MGLLGGVYQKQKEKGMAIGYALSEAAYPGWLAATITEMETNLEHAAKGDVKALRAVVNKYSALMQTEIDPKAREELNRKLSEFFYPILAEAQGIPITKADKRHEYLEEANNYFMALYKYGPDTMKGPDNEDVLVKYNVMVTVPTIMGIYRYHHPENSKGCDDKGDFLLKVYDFKKEAKMHADHMDILDITSTYERGAEMANAEAEPEERKRLLAKAAFVYAREGSFTQAETLITSNKLELKKIPRIDVWEFVGEELERENKLGYAKQAYEYAIGVLDTVPAQDYRGMRRPKLEDKIHRIDELQKKG